MKHPELGTNICFLRNQKGITQKELAESCNIDIRTLQRIESGNVTPRMSTLKLLAEALSCDINTFLDKEEEETPERLSHRFLASIFIIGLVYFLNWLFFSRYELSLPIDLEGGNVYFLSILSAVVYTVTGVIFYYGFNRLGKHYKNKLLTITSFIIMICITLFLLTLLMTMEYSFATHLNAIVVFIMSINGFFFGAGLFITKSSLATWYKLAGILQLMASPFFLIRTSITQLIGFWLCVPFLLLLLILVFKEYKQSHRPLPHS